MELKDVLAKNLKMIADARGLSSRSMAMQCGMPQKAVYSMLHADYHRVRECEPH